MGETLGTVHSEAKFLFISEPVKSEKLCISKMQWWDKYRMDSLIPKRRNQKKERGDGSQVNPKPSIANSIRS